jgi:hypothetical protein
MQYPFVFSASASSGRRECRQHREKKLESWEENFQAPGRPAVWQGQRLVPQSLIVTADFAETVEAEEDAPQRCFAIPSIHDS